MTIPDQNVAVTNLGNVTFRMRDADSNTQWTDAGGRRASLDGTIVTDYEDATSILFRGGLHKLQALETTSLRPNPDKWDAVTTNYIDTSAALAALGGRARGTYLFVTFDAAFLAFRTLQLDITNAAPGPIVITNGNFTTNATRCGILSAQVDVDGLELPLGLGQPIPDVLHGSLPPIVETNAAAGAITNLGGRERRLSYPINIPNLTIDMAGMIITGSVAGLIVANAIIPELPPPLLSMRRLGADIVLAWPTNALGFALEFTTELPATNWWPALPPPVVADGQNVVTNEMTRSATFYRLRKP